MKEQWWVSAGAENPSVDLASGKSTAYQVPVAVVSSSSYLSPHDDEGRGEAAQGSDGHK